MTDPLEKLTIVDDFILGVVMRNPVLCKIPLELILGVQNSRTVSSPFFSTSRLPDGMGARAVPLSHGALGGGAPHWKTMARYFLCARRGWA